MLAKVLKKIANIFGLTINRKHSGKNVKFDIFAEPLYIEFIGVSGVGKTTLYKNVKAQRKSSVKWIERYDFLSFQIKENIDTEISNSYLRLLESKSIMVFNSELHIVDKIKLLNFFYQNVYEEVGTLLYNKNGTIINEDGLFHNFGKEIKDLDENDPGFFNQLCQNRAIVFCTNTAENIAKQIQKRQVDTNAIRPHHKVNSFKELVEIQNPLLKETTSYVKFLEKNNIPVLYINTADDISENASKVNSFIKHLQLKQK